MTRLSLLLLASILLRGQVPLGNVIMDGTTYPLTTAGLQAAVNAMPGVVWIPPNTTINLDAAVTATGVSDISIIGSGPTSILKKTAGAGVYAALDFRGTVGVGSLLAADAPDGSTTVTLTAGGVAALGLAAGDYIFMADNVLDFNHTTKVQATAGDVVTLVDALTQNWTTARAATLKKMSPAKNIRISNLHIDGTLNTGVDSPCTFLLLTAEAAIDKVSTDGCGGVVFYYSYHPKVRDLSLFNGWAADYGALHFHASTNCDASSVSSTHTNGGFGIYWKCDAGTYTNMHVAGAGRPWKFESGAHNTGSNVVLTGLRATTTGLVYSFGAHDNITTGLQCPGFSEQCISIFGGTPPQDQNNNMVIGAKMKKSPGMDANSDIQFDPTNGKNNTVQFADSAFTTTGVGTGTMNVYGYTTHNFVQRNRPPLFTALFDSPVVFDPNLGIVQKVTLRGNTSPYIVDPNGSGRGTLADETTFYICQDLVGDWNWNWGPLFRGATALPGTANQGLVQTFWWDGSHFVAKAPAQTGILCGS